MFFSLAIVAVGLASVVGAWGLLKDSASEDL